MAKEMVIRIIDEGDHYLIPEQVLRKNGVAITTPGEYDRSYIPRLRDTDRKRFYRKLFGKDVIPRRYVATQQAQFEHHPGLKDMHNMYVIEGKSPLAICEKYDIANWYIQMKISQPRLNWTSERAARGYKPLTGGGKKVYIEPPPSFE